MVGLRYMKSSWVKPSTKGGGVYWENNLFIWIPVSGWVLGVFLSTIPVHKEAHTFARAFSWWWRPLYSQPCTFHYQCSRLTSLTTWNAILSVPNYPLSVDTGGALQSCSALGEEHLEPRTAVWSKGILTGTSKPSFQKSQPSPQHLFFRSALRVVTLEGSRLSREWTCDVC